MRNFLRLLAVLLVGLVVAFLLGPRVPVDTTVRPIELPADLDRYLSDSEAQFSDIVPETEKTIIWAGERGAKTPLAIVSLHGFSATRQESAPLADDLAAQWGANLYYTRFTGHGRTGDAMAEATVNDWINDSEEALAIGQRLGERVIVIGVSTGATAATWLAAQHNDDNVLAYVLISPNYAPKDSASEILTWPWGGRIAELLIGPERTWEPANDAQARYWMTRYPTAALLPMMGFVKLVRSQELEAIQRPILVIYSPNDQVINPDRVEEAYERFGSPIKKLVAIDDPQDPSNHVLAGRILSPDDTPKIEQIILDFVASLE